MGRPSKLNDEQWAEVLRCATNGETLASLAVRFGVSKSAISEKISGRIQTVKTLAKTIASAESQLEAMPVSERLATRNLADYLRSIGTNLATAAEMNTHTSVRFARLAKKHMDKVEAGDLTKTPAVAGLIKVSNEAASIGVAFMTANKPKEDPETPGMKSISSMTDEELREIVRSSGVIE